MKTGMKRIGMLVCTLLGLGAVTSPADAADTPPVLEQTATIIGTIPQEHSHPQLDHWAKNDGKKKEFKVKLKFLRRYLRHFDMQGRMFDEVEKPSLFLINGEHYPLSVDSFEFDPPCNPPSSKCFRVKDFPFAFGIHQLKNEDGKEYPHAFLYIPARLDSGDAGEVRPPYLGDSFALIVFHIPEDDAECDKLHHEISKSHCRVIYNLNQLNGKYSEGRFAIEIQQAYRNWFDHLLDGASIDSSTRQLKLGGNLIPDSVDALSQKPDLRMYIKILLGILSHNEIVHGSLK